MIAKVHYVWVPMWPLALFAIPTAVFAVYLAKWVWNDGILWRVIFLTWAVVVVCWCMAVVLTWLLGWSFR